MDTPIKVAVMSSGFSAFTAFACTDLMKNGRGRDKNQSIVEALVAAGAIEIIDLDAPKLEAVAAV